MYKTISTYKKITFQARIIDTIRVRNSFPKSHKTFINSYQLYYLLKGTAQQLSFLIFSLFLSESYNSNYLSTIAFEIPNRLVLVWSFPRIPWTGHHWRPPCQKFCKWYLDRINPPPPSPPKNFFVIIANRLSQISQNKL